jgi:hypothetical protein
MRHRPTERGARHDPPTVDEGLTRDRHLRASAGRMRNGRPVDPRSVRKRRSSRVGTSSVSYRRDSAALTAQFRAAPPSRATRDPPRMSTPAVSVSPQSTLRHPPARANAPTATTRARASERHYAKARLCYGPAPTARPTRQLSHRDPDRRADDRGGPHRQGCRIVVQATGSGPPLRAASAPDSTLDAEMPQVRPSCRPVLAGVVRRELRAG